MGNINKRELGIIPPIEYNHDEMIKRILKIKESRNTNLKNIEERNDIVDEMDKSNAKYNDNLDDYSYNAAYDATIREDIISENSEEHNHTEYEEVEVEEDESEKRMSNNLVLQRNNNNNFDQKNNLNNKQNLNQKNKFTEENQEEEQEVTEYEEIEIEEEVEYEEPSVTKNSKTKNNYTNYDETQNVKFNEEYTEEEVEYEEIEIEEEEEIEEDEYERISDKNPNHRNSRKTPNGDRYTTGSELSRGPPVIKTRNQDNRFIIRDDNGR